MKEIEGNLETNNTAYISYIFSKLIKSIYRNISRNSEIKDLPELKFLESKCTNEKQLISLTAAKCLIKLIQNNVIRKEQILFELVSAITVAKAYGGLCHVINEILLLSIDANDVNHYNLQSPQHPLVTLLHQCPESATDIYSDISYTYRKLKETSSLNDLYLPVYFFIFCGPHSECQDVVKHKFWSFLIHINEADTLNLIMNIINWLQYSSKTNLLGSVDLLIQILELAINTRNYDLVETLVLVLSNLLLEILKHKLNPRNIIPIILEAIKFLGCFPNSSSLLLIISKCFSECPVIYLQDLLELCQTLLSVTSVDKISIKSLQVSLFYWMIFRNELVEENERIKDLIFSIENAKIEEYPETDILSNAILRLIRNSYPDIYLATEFVILSRTLNCKNISHWLNRCDNVPITFLKEAVIFFNALFLYEFDDAKISIKIKEILLKTVEFYKEYSTFLLTTLLYKLSKARNPDIHLELLKSVPKMAVCKENAPFILHALDSFKKGSTSSKTFALLLFYELWKVDVKYYIYLQHLLIENTNLIHHDEWELYVTKAWILKEICVQRPELYGAELVSYLSDLLNTCGRASGMLPSSLAIEGISALCRAGIVDIYSTWKELSPKLCSDRRRQVLTSFCGFMSEIPHYSEVSEKYFNLSKEVTSTLWNLTLDNNDIEIITKAYHALRSFKLEELSITIPDIYKVVSSKEENLFGLVHGECWINVLSNGNYAAMDAAGDLLIQLVNCEISNFRSKTYQVAESLGEPQNYLYLPAHSVLRAVISFIKRNVMKWKTSTIEPVFVQCLRILSQEYKKPLPPLDWCFLQELIHYEETKSYCITIASHQVQLSGTARRFMENIIMALTNDGTEVLYFDIYKNLNFLCSSIQPIILKPFIENSITRAFQSIQNDEKTFNFIILYLKNTLARENIHEAGRMTLADVVVNFAKNLDPHSLAFKKVLECIAELPEGYISQFALKGESEKHFNMFIKVRCCKAIIAKEKPFSWLKDIMEPKEYSQKEQIIILQELTKVLNKHKDDPDVCMWIMELMGQTQALLADNEVTEKSLVFLCKVIITSLITFSGHGILTLHPAQISTDINYALRLFPQAVASLIDSNLWSSYTAQVLDWLHHMSNCKIINSFYQLIFYQTISALRHEKAFEEKLKWMKYIDKKIQIMSL